MQEAMNDREKRIFYYRLLTSKLLLLHTKHIYIYIYIYMILYIYIYILIYIYINIYTYI